MTKDDKGTPEERYWNLRLGKAAEALAANNFGVSTHASASDASRHLVEKILGPGWKGAVNFGGSASVLQAGVVPLLLRHPGATVIETHDPTNRNENFSQLRRDHFLCDLFLASSNAVTMDGKLYNVDGTGNRVASLIYGPSKVVLFVGRNKLCDSLDAAKDRVRNLAAPMNCMRLNLPNPCVKTGKCMDCNSPKRTCNYETVIERSNPAGRIHILLINEILGF